MRVNSMPLVQCTSVGEKEYNFGKEADNFALCFPASWPLLMGLGKVNSMRYFSSQTHLGWSGGNVLNWSFDGEGSGSRMGREGKPNHPHQLVAAVDSRRILGCGRVSYFKSSPTTYLWWDCERITKPHFSCSHIPSFLKCEGWLLHPSALCFLLSYWWISVRELSGREWDLILMKIRALHVWEVLLFNIFYYYW